MKVNNKEFEVLVYLEKNPEQNKKINDIIINTKIATEEVEESIVTLQDKGFITGNEEAGFTITKTGIENLQPYRVKRAVIMAAGKGTRMMPVTKFTPKPLVKVNGKMMIETLLDAIKEAEIEEIYIVRGYLADEFNQLLNKYPNIKFIENSYYNDQNTISSAYVSRQYFGNAYILDADLVLYNKNIIRKYEFAPNYLGKYVKKTDDFMYKTSGDFITSYGRGGEECYLMYGVAYFDKETSIKYSQDIEKVYNSIDGKNKYFDEVNLKDYKQNYNFMIKKCNEGDIIELDTFDELKQVDGRYNDPNWQIKMGYSL